VNVAVSGLAKPLQLWSIERKSCKIAVRLVCGSTIGALSLLERIALMPAVINPVFLDMTSETICESGSS
jgi:hypothetical protein